MAESNPELFKGAWIDTDICELSFEQNSRVSHILIMGGDIDEWGEGSDYYTAFDWFKQQWEWYGDFTPYGCGHEFEGYPDTGKFKPTSRNLLKLARGVK